MTLKIRNYKNFKTPKNFYTLYGAAVENININKPLGTYFYTFFCVRRIMYTFSMLLLPGQALTQWLLFIYGSLMTLIFMQVHQPFTSKKPHFTEFYNELTVLTCGFMSIPMVPYFDFSISIKKDMSFGILVLVSIQIVLNLLIILIDQFS